MIFLEFKKKKKRFSVNVLLASSSEKNKMIPGVFFFNTNVWLFAYHAE